MSMLYVGSLFSVSLLLVLIRQYTTIRQWKSDNVLIFVRLVSVSIHVSLTLKKNYHYYCRVWIFPYRSTAPSHTHTCTLERGSTSTKTFFFNWVIFFCLNPEEFLLLPSLIITA